MTDLRKHAVEATWTDVERLVYRIAWAFVRKYGGDPAEAIADAGTYYMRAYETYDPTRGIKFLTYAGSQVYWRLRYERQKAQRRLARERVDAEIVEQAPGFDPDEPEPAVAKLLRVPDASDDGTPLGRWRAARADAAAVARLVVESPDALMRAAQGRPLGHNVLRDFLRAAGWEPKRIRGAFERIRLVLAR